MRQRTLVLQSLVFAVAVLFVIPAGDLLLLLPLLVLWLSSPQGLCFCHCPSLALILCGHFATVWRQSSLQIGCTKRDNPSNPSSTDLMPPPALHSLKTEVAKDFQDFWHDFTTQKSAARYPALPHFAPLTDHKNTTANTRSSQKPLQKR
ncbi:MAG TPA: hypothetical protein VIX90_09400 [Edaphobacter sp.]